MIKILEKSFVQRNDYGRERKQQINYILNHTYQNIPYFMEQKVPGGGKYKNLYK